MQKALWLLTVTQLGTSYHQSLSGLERGIAERPTPLLISILAGARLNGSRIPQASRIIQTALTLKLRSSPCINALIGSKIMLSIFLTPAIVCDQYSLVPSAKRLMICTV